MAAAVQTARRLWPSSLRRRRAAAGVAPCTVAVAQCTADAAAGAALPAGVGAAMSPHRRPVASCLPKGTADVAATRRALQRSAAAQRPCQRRRAARRPRRLRARRTSLRLRPAGGAPRARRSANSRGSSRRCGAAHARPLAGLAMAGAVAEGERHRLATAPRLRPPNAPPTLCVVRRLTNEGQGCRPPGGNRGAQLPAPLRSQPLARCLWCGRKLEGQPAARLDVVAALWRTVAVAQCTAAAAQCTAAAGAQALCAASMAERRRRHRRPVLAHEHRAAAAVPPMQWPRR
eukprot:365527-Chlamydomonas_euryale.AAC.2